ncbi:hypothetical protein [Acinetobacter sp. Leaf130]|uniref:hypothetical protein n=1 Tax=Acinetobacter sp. Leaf130 TaxID=1736269 RepID=UPI0006FCBA2F|nr:hypothetical protein [Acinetobacter sp. Leaf130]KQQ76999.1 hypothetical protein ASF86_05710 [Acinetobacter sp. Leaf130]
MSINQQTEILNSLLQIMHDSVSTSYDSLECVFDYYKDSGDGSLSIGSKFAYIDKDNVNYALLNDPDYRVNELIIKLHDLMVAHTGGVGKSLLLV